MKTDARLLFPAGDVRSYENALRLLGAVDGLDSAVEALDFWVENLSSRVEDLEEEAGSFNGPQIQVPEDIDLATESFSIPQGLTMEYFLGAVFVFEGDTPGYQMILRIAQPEDSPNCIELDTSNLSFLYYPETGEITCL